MKYLKYYKNSTILLIICSFNYICTGDAYEKLGKIEKALEKFTFKMKLKLSKIRHKQQLGENNDSDWSINMSGEIWESLKTFTDFKFEQLSSSNF